MGRDLRAGAGVVTIGAETENPIGGPTPSDALVLFGVTGDLAHKMIFPALYAMAKRDALNVPVVGVALPPWSLAQLRKRAADGIRKAGRIDDARAIESSQAG
jgi:glucose-6-phosphate 1-dehydrogenase